MADENELLKRRFFELAGRAGGYYTYTDFLGLAEQSYLNEVMPKIRVSVTTFGGAVGCERVVACFGDKEDLGYEPAFPITCIEITPKSEKYAEKLTHRDILGSALALGIVRQVLGDIVVRENKYYLFCLDTIAEYIKEGLTRVRKTDVFCKICDSLPEGEMFKTEEARVQITSERLDAVIAKLYHLSRADAQALFARGLVFVSGREVTNTSYVPKQNDKVTVRGLGRFIYRGFVGESKKGKLNVEIEIYK